MQTDTIRARDETLDVQRDHPELIAICLNCKYPECIGQCRDYKAKKRSLEASGEIRTRPRSSVTKLPTKKRVEGRALFEYRGQWLTIKQIARIAGITDQKLYYRLVQTNGDIEVALDDKLFALRNKNGRGKMFEARGESHTIDEWAAIIGIPRKRLYDRIAWGHTMEEALAMGVDAKKGRRAKT